MAQVTQTARYLFTPAETASRFVEYAQWMIDDPGLDWGVSELDKRAIPLRPGEIEAYIGRPGHGKTSVLAYRAARAAKQIIQRGTQENEVVVFISYEQPVEQIEASIQAQMGGGFSVSDVGWGRVDMEAVRRQSIKRPQLPVWFMGKSLLDRGKRVPPMYIDTVYKELLNMERDYGKIPVLICFDYLQIMPIRDKKDRAGEVAEACYQLEDLAVTLACPACVGAQAKTGVESSASKIPTLADAYYTAVLDHIASKSYGLFKPCRAVLPEMRAEIEVGGIEYSTQTDWYQHLFFLKMNKQRFEHGSYLFPCHFDMSTLDFRGIDMNRTQLDY